MKKEDSVKAELKYIVGQDSKELGIIVGKCRGGLSGIAAIKKKGLVTIKNLKRLHYWFVTVFLSHPLTVII